MDPRTEPGGSVIDPDPPLRGRRRRPHHLPRVRLGARATSSTSSRSPSTRARCAWPHRRAGVAGRRQRRTEREPRSPCSRRPAPPARRRPASAASAGASGSTPCASSATPATSSPSARSTRSTRVDLRPHGAARGGRAGDPRLLRLPAPAGRRASARRRARTRRTTGARRAPSCPCSTSPTPPARPPHRRTVARLGYSEAEYDHHAFLYWAATGLAVLPVEAYGEKGSEGFVGAAAYRLGPTGTIAEAGRLEHPARDRGDGVPGAPLAGRGRPALHAVGRRPAGEPPRRSRPRRLAAARRAPGARAERAVSRARAAAGAPAGLPGSCPRDVAAAARAPGAANGTRCRHTVPAAGSTPSSR